jgi:hypothetical protein
MCDPISLSVASLAIGVASAGAGFIQQGQQAKSNRKAAQANYAQQSEALKTQYDQTNKQATDEMSVKAREVMIETARLRVLGGESGLAGGSNDRIENESQFNLGTDIAAIESNRRNTLNQLYEEGKSLRAGSQAQIRQVQRPSLIGTGLQIAGAGVNAATTHKYLSGKLK